MDLDEDFDMKDFFSTRLTKCETEDMTENWSSETDDILNTFFPMDFLHNLNGHQDDFSNLDDFPEHVKIEQEDYKVTVPLLPETFLSEKSSLFSSNSSDSGLSSDNLEVEMNPPYEPLSPASSDTSTNKCSKEDKLTSPNNEFKSKVIVQQVPQVINITNTGKVNPTILNPPNSQCYQQRTALNTARGNEVKIVKLSPQMFASSNKKPVTIQVKNSNSGARIQAKPGTLFLNKVNFNEIKKIVRVQNSNPRSVLIPVSYQDVKKLKAFKIINTATHASTAKSAECNNYVREKEIEKQTNFQAMDTHKDVIACIENSSDSESIIIEEDYDNEEYVHDPEIPYPKLVLTTEEKRLLNKEGINLPAHYPLTKHEERELKRIRRKIRNKISAQDSRKRKKEYVDGLEERVKQCTEENQTLIKRIKQLQNQNQNLMSQMKKLQSLLAKGTNKTTQPTTCLMVLLLSLALVAAPNLKLGQNSKESDLEEVVQESILQNRRSLLFNNNDQNIDIFDEELNMSDTASALETNNEYESNNYASSSWGEPKCKQMKLINSDFINDVDDENWYLRNKDQVKTISTNEIYFLKNNEENLQSSGFNINIHNKQNKDGGKQTWLNQNVYKMVSHGFNDLNELNIDKFASLNDAEMPEANIVDLGSSRYTSPLNVNQNSSKMRQNKKY